MFIPVSWQLINEKSTFKKKLLWTEFLTDFQNIGIKIFKKARRLIKKYSKNFRRGLRGPKMTKNIFCTKFSFFALFGPFNYPLQILLFFWDSRVYSKHFGILLLKLEKNWIFFLENTVLKNSILAQFSKLRFQNVWNKLYYPQKTLGGSYEVQKWPKMRFFSPNFPFL